MKIVAATLLAAALAVAAAVLYFAVLRPRAIRENEAAAVATLETLREAQLRFRVQDRDGNKINDFWTADIAGLDVPGLTDGRPLRGYLFIPLLDHDCSTANDIIDPRMISYLDDRLSGFGFCAYPADYGRTGKTTFLLCEHGDILRLDSGGRPVTRWPGSACPQLMWQKLD
ncbi:MAG TPA: DUF2950 family protein [Planctomycetota bacterium]